MKNKNTESNSAAQTQSAEQLNNKINIDHNDIIKYVVVRDGYRVSDKEYLSDTDPKALNEHAFWDRISRFQSWGEKVEIVEYDNRKHRVW